LNSRRSSARGTPAGGSSSTSSAPRRCSATAGSFRSSIRTKGAEYTETVDVDVVQITATVTGKGGRFVRGLGASDFKVYEDGVPQPITSFQSENIPLELVVAVDVSGSMTKRCRR